MQVPVHACIEYCSRYREKLQETFAYSEVGYASEKISHIEQRACIVNFTGCITCRITIACPIERGRELVVGAVTTRLCAVAKDDVSK